MAIRHYGDNFRRLCPADIMDINHTIVEYKVDNGSES